MKNDRRFFVFGLLLIAFSIGLNLFAHFSSFGLRLYIKGLSVPLQRPRGAVFGSLPFSVGDLFYILLILFLLFLLGKIILGLFLSIKKRSWQVTGVSHLFLTLSGLIFLFILFWGGNYNRPALTTQWNLPEEQRLTPTELLTLNQMLIQRLAVLSEDSIVFPDLSQLNQQNDSVYKNTFGNNLPQLRIKPTLFGSLLSYLGVSGYYNPFTGEGQFNRGLPEFMHPFIVAHEMAHQTGIAAEDDANLLAYIICIKSNQKANQYSAYFNLLTYSLPELGFSDSLAARNLSKELPSRVKKDWKALRAYYRPYRGTTWDLSNSFYNNYLKFNGQKDGLESYDKIVTWAYYWDYIKKERVSLKLYPFHN